MAVVPNHHDGVCAAGDSDNLSSLERRLPERHSIQVSTVSVDPNRVPFLPFNSLDIDKVFRVDARLTKVLPFTERVHAYLNLEAFNVFNTQYNTFVNTEAYPSGQWRPNPFLRSRHRATKARASRTARMLVARRSAFASPSRQLVQPIAPRGLVRFGPVPLCISDKLRLIHAYHITDVVARDIRFPTSRKLMAPMP